VRGLCLSPDGKYVYVVHVLARYQMPTTQLERGWMNTNALSILDAAARKLINTVLLDDVDLGAANPWGVTTSGDGKTIFVTHAGTNELSVIDAPGLMEKLAKIEAAAAKNKPGQPAPGSYADPVSSTPAEVPNDLAFLVSLRRRIKLEGTGARGVAAIGSNVFAAEYFSDALSVVDLESKSAQPVSQIALGPPPQWTEQRRGEALFFDATICFQHWQSCGTCHPDARADGLNWDLTNDGLGNPKNTRNMLHVFHSGPTMSLGVRENAAATVRAGITQILFAVRPEEDAKALDEYLKSLDPVPSPYLVDGKLSPAAERGKKLFFDVTVGCGKCHPEPYYTDKRSHDVGSVGKYDKPSDKFNTPRLTEIWRTAPYMHDGHYLTIKDLLVQGKHGAPGVKEAKLSDKDLDDLAEFVNSL
jgi:mono/diheme cytochrome c family protein